MAASLTEMSPRDSEEQDSVENVSISGQEYVEESLPLMAQGPPKPNINNIFREVNESHINHVSSIFILSTDSDSQCY